MATYACKNIIDGSWCGWAHRDKKQAISCCAGALKHEGIERKPESFMARADIFRTPVHGETLAKVIRIAGTKESNRLARDRDSGELTVLGTPEPKVAQPQPQRSESKPEPSVPEPKVAGLDDILGAVIGVQVATVIDAKIASGELKVGEVDEKKLLGSIGEMIGALESKVGESITKQLADAKVEFEKMIDERQPKLVKIMVNREEFKIPEGQHIHQAMAEIIESYECRSDFALIGPTGCGKTHAIQQFAETKGISWGCVSMTEGVTESQLVGRREPKADGGFDFVGTEFLRIFEEGGIFLLGEADAADANVLLALNNALSNGWLAVPHRLSNPIARRHKDFVCCIDMNTFGRGGNRQFVRNRQDVAFLDRFWQLELDYDRDLERSLVENKDWRNWCWSLRDAVEELRLERSVSTRQMMAADFRIRAVKMPMDRAKDQMVKGWTADERKRLESKGIRLPKAVALGSK